MNKPFKDEKEMIAKVKSVWKDCASNVVEIRKAMKEFTGRLQAVKEHNEWVINQNNFDNFCIFYISFYTFH